eukprot:gene9782-7665_t
MRTRTLRIETSDGYEFSLRAHHELGFDNRTLSASLGEATGENLKQYERNNKERRHPSKMSDCDDLHWDRRLRREGWWGLYPLEALQAAGWGYYRVHNELTPGARERADRGRGAHEEARGRQLDAIYFAGSPAVAGAGPTRRDVQAGAAEGTVVAPSTATQFLRPHLLKLAAYTPIEPFEILSARYGRKPEDIIKLDANENPYGPPPEVLAALGTMKYPHIYPDPESRRLRKALGELNDIPMEHLLVGCGADELIDLLMRCVLEPGDSIVDCPPTFTMYAFDAEVNNAKVITVPRLPGFQMDIPGIKQAVSDHKSKMVFLTSPNNPDGSMMSDAEHRTSPLRGTVTVEWAFLLPAEHKVALCRASGQYIEISVGV